MTQDPPKSPWRTVLFWVAGVCFVLAAPCLFFGVLGLVGVAADVGPDENRRIGLTSLGYALIPLGVGGVILLVALMLGRKR